MPLKEKDIDILDIFKKTIALYKNDLILFIFISIIDMILTIPIMLFKSTKSLLLPLIVSNLLIWSYFSPLIKLTIYRKYKSILLNKNVLKDAFERYWKYLGLTAVLTAILVLGTVLLVVPGLYFLILYYLSSTILVLENETIFRTMNKSKLLAKSSFWQTVVLGSALILISIPGSLFYNNERFRWLYYVYSMIITPIIQIAPIIFYDELYRIKVKTGIIDDYEQKGKQKNNYLIWLVIPGFAILFFIIAFLTAKYFGNIPK